MSLKIYVIVLLLELEKWMQKSIAHLPMIYTHSFRQALKQIIIEYLLCGRHIAGHHVGKGRHELGSYHLSVAYNPLKVVIGIQDNIQ